MSKTNFFKLFFRLIVSLILIGFLVVKTDFTESLFILGASNLSWVTVGLIAILANVLVSSWRLQYILEIFKLHKSIPYLVKLYLVGNFYNNFLPTQMGGDVYKAYKLSKDLKRPGEGTFTIFMDRFSGLSILFLIGLVGLFLKFGLIGLAISIGLFVTAIGSYGIGLRFFSKKVSIVAKFKKANDIFVNNKNKAFKVFLTAVLVQIFAIGSQLFVFYAVGVNIPIWSAFVYFPVITIMGLIPSINGIGIQDAGFIFFFGTLGVMQEQAFAASMLYHLMRFSFSLLGGGVLFLSGVSLKRKLL